MKADRMKTIKEEEPTFKEDVKDTVRIMFSKRMAFMMPQIIWSGTSIAYWSGLLTPINTLALKTQYPDIKEKRYLSESLFAMMFLGIGQAISGLIMGFIIDLFNSRRACIANVIVMGCTFFVSVVNLQRMEFGWISYLTCFMWGLQDGCLNTHSYQMLGFEFESQNAPFAIYQLV